MGIKWRTQKEVRLINEAWKRKGDLAIDKMAVNDGEVRGLAGGIYYLVDLTPLGGWKGKSWAILSTDFTDIEAWYFASRAEAENQRKPARDAAGA